MYLLDVNALLALGCSQHMHHQRVEKWLAGLHMETGKVAPLATCAITELGFVRIASGKAALLSSVEIAKSALYLLKRRRSTVFMGDALGAECLPDWVRKSEQTTDGHLLDLAAKHGARLATLDTGIPGALLIPEYSPGWTLRESTVPYGTAAA